MISQGPRQISLTSSQDVQFEALDTPYHMPADFINLLQTEESYAFCRGRRQRTTQRSGQLRGQVVKYAAMRCGPDQEKGGFCVANRFAYCQHQPRD